MNEKTDIQAQANQDYSRYLVPFSVIALIAGTFARFWQLGGAPLAVDEYYFGSSILNILDRGLPEFPCGGYYTRGVLIQYLALPLIYFGATLEFATRFWPAVFSLLTIAGVWRIGILAGGRSVALIAVILCSLSVWEVEFARFGRMYSPFQAIFVWYVYFQICHLVQGRDRARWLCLGLSGLAIFVYAGAVFMLALNFLAAIWPGKRWSYVYLLAAFGLLFVGVFDQSIDYRRLGVIGNQLQPVLAESSGASLPVQLPDIPRFTLLIVATVIPLVAFCAWRYRMAFRAAHPAILFWSAAALCLCFGLLGLGSTLFVVGLIIRLPKPAGITIDDAKHWPIKVLGIVFLWLTIFTVSSAISGDNLWVNFSGAMNYIFNFPDVYHKVLIPWLRTIPVTAAILGLFVTISISVLFLTAIERQSERSVLRYLVATSILMVLLVGITEQPYRTTRYTYFLYPIVLVLSSVGINHVTRFVTRNSGLRFLAAMLCMVTLASFAEDFRIDHLARINDPQFRYRTAYSTELAGHYYLRWDYRGAADYVNGHLQENDSVVVFDQPMTYYLTRTSGVFLRQGTPIHMLTSACGGVRHLWSNAPLLDQDEELRRLIDNTIGSTWLVMRTELAKSRDPLETTLIDNYVLSPVFRSQDGNLGVYRLRSLGLQE